MKKTILFLLFSMTLFAQAPSWHQYGVRTGTLFPAPTQNKIDVNGRLKLSTTAGGFIPSWLTTTERLAVSSPQVGESVYDTTLSAYYHWNGSSWVASGGGTIPNLQQTTDAGSITTNQITVQNVKIGSNAFGNTIIGNISSLPTGTGTTAIGHGAGNGTAGFGGTYLGASAGSLNAFNRNICLSANANASTASADNQFVINTNSKNLRFDTNIPLNILFQFPLVGGRFPISVNGNTADANGNITVSSGGGTWGPITGMLSAQTDLQTALDGKQNNDSDLTDIAALAPPNDNIVQRKSGAWTSRTPTQLKTDLSLVKGDVGLGNVDNTSDANKPVSNAVSTEYNSASALTFSGPIDLSKKGGSYYAEHTQTGAITFSVSATTVGGLAQVTIIANGSAINLVGGWINVAGEPVSTVNGTTNYMVIWQTNNKVFYSVKVY
jgi:uncharacterized protein (UPF0303 family)